MKKLFSLLFASLLVLMWALALSATILPTKTFKFANEAYEVPAVFPEFQGWGAEVQGTIPIAKDVAVGLVVTVNDDQSVAVFVAVLKEGDKYHLMAIGVNYLKTGLIEFYEDTEFLATGASSHKLIKVDKLTDPTAFVEMKKKVYGKPSNF